MVSVTLNTLTLLLPILAITSVEGRNLKKFCKTPKLKATKSVEGVALIADPISTSSTADTVDVTVTVTFTQKKGTPPPEGVTLNEPELEAPPPITLSASGTSTAPSVITSITSTSINTKVASAFINNTYTAISNTNTSTFPPSSTIEAMGLVADPISKTSGPEIQYTDRKGTPPTEGVTLNDYDGEPPATTQIYANPLRSSESVPVVTVTSTAPAIGVSDSISTAIAASSIASAVTSAVQSAPVGNNVSSGTNAGPASGKAGIGWPVQEADAAPVAQFFTPESTVSWWFNWNKNWNQGILNSDGVQISGEFVPMIFNAEFLDNSDTFQEGFTELMGYNEPDLKATTGVALHMEPAEAAEKWKTQIVQIRQQYPNVKIHSPAMASNKTWLVEFFKLICPDNSAANGWGDCQYKPDYLSSHMYTTDFEYFKGTLTGNQKDFGLPMVLSEFACYKFGADPHPPAEEVSTFMEQTMAWLDQQDWVVKYAWFGTARDPQYLYGVYETNRLMDTSGALTDLGKQYMNGGKKLS